VHDDSGRHDSFNTSAICSLRDERQHERNHHSRKRADRFKRGHRVFVSFEKLFEFLKHYFPGYADAARAGGGSNITTMRLLPQRGHRNRLSSRESGNARPRVQTGLSKSNSRR
jgi:hypothetical protein